MTRKLLFSFSLLFLPFFTDVLQAQTDYKMAGPYAIVARDGQHRHTKGGSERDMRMALTFAQQGKYQQARAIIDAYASTLQGFDGHDAPLCLIQAYDLVRAMTIVANNEDSKANQTPLPWGGEGGGPSSWTAMVRRAILPTIEQFDAASPYANGNWGAIVNRCRMACGIFLRDSTLYKSSIDYYLHANDNGSLPRYIGPS